MSIQNQANEATRSQSVTRADVETVAHDEGKPVLEVLTLLQAGAARLNDGERVLKQLCAIKSEILAERTSVPLQVGKWYAEIEDDGALGVLYRCIDRFIDIRGIDTYVMAEESDDSEPRYISGRSGTTEFWMPQL